MIQKGIPAPESTRRGRPAKYPFAKMEIGDCYEVEGLDQGKRAAKAAFRYGARHGMKFSTRTTDEGLRIWRIA